MLSTDPTEVPPNFITIMASEYHRTGRPARGAITTALGVPHGVSTPNPLSCRASPPTPEISRTIGTAATSGHSLAVAHTEEEGTSRIISARRATRQETKFYEEE
jgi:hypothetical protein